MKLSLNWLNDFVDLSGIDIKDIVSRFCLCTAEIEGYEVRTLPHGVIVAEVKECEKIADSKKLSKLTVWDGTKNVPVVCGAPNVRAGLKVAFAPAGTCVGEFRLEKIKLGGHDSHGMCMSAKELGISDDHDGILELDPKLPAGAKLNDVMPFASDIILEIDNKSITNRPDLWGHYGVARELSVIFDRKLKPLATIDVEQYAKLPAVSVKIESPMCMSYGAIRVENITTAQLPIELRTRLYYLEINPHGFTVDLSNLLMLELGQPNHTFNSGKVDKISIGHIEGGKFLTLKEEIKVGKEMLFIKSNGAPVALAGIIGGKESEIAGDTRDAVWEFATFDSMCIRKTATQIGIRTDASVRFEKSLDTNLNKLTAERMLWYLSKFDKGAKVASRWSYASTAETKEIKLSVDKNYAERFAGVKFDWKEVEKKLAGLGFSPVLSAERVDVTVPTWRASKDVTLGADVIEEIVRTFGYDKIVPLPPRVDVMPVNQPPYKKFMDLLRDKLAFVHKCQEVHTYIWSETPTALKVVNSCVKGCDSVRQSMIPSMLGVVKRNRANIENIRIFEIGSVENAKLGERKHLCIAVNGAGAYVDVANIVRDIFHARFELGASKNALLHPRNNALILVDGKTVGEIGVVIDGDAAVAEIDLFAIDPTIKPRMYPSPSKYQKSVLDFTFETDKPYGYIQDIFDKFKHPLNMGYRLKDVFKNKYTLAFTVGSFDKTLTSDDINDIWKKIIETGRKNGLTLDE